MEPISPRSLQRRIKRYFAKENHTLFAICEPPFETVLAEEIRTHFDPETPMEIVKGGVEFKASTLDIARANLLLRTAVRVLLRVDEFLAQSYPELFHKARKIRWEFYLGTEPSFRFHVVSTRSRLHHTEHITKAVHDAIIHYYARYNMTMAEKMDPVTIHIRFHEDRCTISLDTSGDFLYRRGYRTHSVRAPIRETTVAALLMKIPLAKYTTILDPCMGSGTFLLEACMILNCGVPLTRRAYAYELLPFFIINSLSSRISDQQKFIGNESPPSIFGIDINHSAVDAAKKNKKNTSCDIQMESGDALILKNRFGANGLILSNLPYGMRVKGANSTSTGFENTTDAFYQNFYANILKEFSGWDFLWIVPDKEWVEKGMPFPVQRDVKFQNGGIPVRAVFGSVPGQ